MRILRLLLNPSVTQRFPAARIGFVIARVNVQPSHPFVDALKSELPAILQEQKITRENYANQPDIAQWRKTYEKMGVKPRTYPCSVEALIRRVAKGDSVWKISSVVDLYNYISVKHVFPMGGYDIGKIGGDIAIREANTGEIFFPLGNAPAIRTAPPQVIYADDQKVLCWLWNHKDSRFSCIDESTKNVVLFFDASGVPIHSTLEAAMKEFGEKLAQLDGQVLTSGILSDVAPEAAIDLADYLSPEEIAALEAKQRVTAQESAQALEGFHAKEAEAAAAAAAPAEPASQQKAGFKPATLGTGFNPSAVFAARVEPAATVRPRGLTDPLESKVIAAVSSGNIDQLRDIARQMGTDASHRLQNIKGSLGASLLFYAAVNANFEMIQVLHDDYGLDLNARNEIGETPLFALMRSGSKEANKIAQWMIEKGAMVEITATDDSTLIARARVQHPTLAQLLEQALGHSAAAPAPAP